MGFLDGAVRIMPNWETNILGYTLSWNLIVPAMIVPGIMITGMFLYPWFEAWITGDRREHNILDRPRNVPVRTAFGAMTISYYMLLWFSGDNDIIATAFHLSINDITNSLRVLVFVVPVLVVVRFLVLRFVVVIVPVPSWWVSVRVPQEQERPAQPASTTRNCRPPATTSAPRRQRRRHGRNG